MVNNNLKEKRGHKKRKGCQQREREREREKTKHAEFSGSHPIPSTLRYSPNQTCQLTFEGQSVKVESQHNAVCTLSEAGINDPIQTL